MRIVLMGPPGAGKGTQAKRLAERFEMQHLSSGDILRVEKSSGSELGDRLAQYMDSGKLVPDDVVVDVMVAAITEASETGGILLDGFPRTVVQARALDDQLTERGKPIDAVVVIDVERDKIVQRITGRRSCGKCGKVYHVRFLPPRRDNLCDECGESLTQRQDDTEEVVRKRLEEYDRQTQPVLDYYRGKAQLRVIDIDGSPAPDEVTESLVEAIEACCIEG